MSQVRWYASFTTYRGGTFLIRPFARTDCHLTILSVPKFGAILFGIAPTWPISGTIARDGCRLGPFSGRELRDLAVCGLLLPTDTVWKAGIEKGVAAALVKHLFPSDHTNALPETTRKSLEGD